MSSIDWSRRVANPEAMGDREMVLWNRIEPILQSIMDELKQNGLIETVFVQRESDALRLCVEKLDDFSRVTNALLHISDSKQKASEFVKLNSKYGLDERTVVTAYVMAALTVSVLKTELFKVLLLFYMKRGGQLSHKVSDFVSTMKYAAPENWPRLKPFVDNPLRNALSHGTYAFVSSKLVLYNDANLEHLEELRLDQIIMRMKDQDVLFHCFINVLKDKAERGFLVS